MSSLKMRGGEEEREMSLSSDDIYKGPIFLLLLLDTKVKAEVDNGSEAPLEY